MLAVFGNRFLRINSFCKDIIKSNFRICSSCIYNQSISLQNNIMCCNLVNVKNNNISITSNYKMKCLFSTTETGTLEKNEFLIICNETLESLCEYFEEIVENCSHLKGADVTYSDGVLTVNFGIEYGTYVINRQTPNHQIWLSSPTSGPKRYDFIPSKKCWIYRHDTKSLHHLLQEEIPKIVKCDVNFLNCAHAC